jgi:hypothetical protein
MMLDMTSTPAPLLDRPAPGPGGPSCPAPSVWPAWLDLPVDALVGVAREHDSGYDPDRPDEEPTTPAGEVSGDPSGEPSASPGGPTASDPTCGPTERQQVTDAVAAIVATDPRPRQRAGELAALGDTLAAMDRLAAHAVRLAGELDGRRAAAEEGMTIDAALRLHTRTAGQDIATVLTAADQLRSMPVVAGLFQRGVLSWGHVRALMVGTRRFGVEARTALDTYLGDHADRLARLDTDRLAWALDDAVEDHRPVRNVERQAERREMVDTLTLQGQLDGTGESYGRHSPETFAELTTLLDREADAPRAAPCPGSGDEVPETPVLTRGQQHAAALMRLLRAGSGRGTSSGGGGGGAPVRFTVIIDVDRITDTAAGHILTGVRGRPPRIVRRAIDRLSCDAALDVVLRDGVDLLAAQRYTPEVTAATRRAVTARDQGCRFPACTAPATWCDIHHVTPRAAGGDHAPTNLVLLCRRHHTLVHRRGWHQTLHADGTYHLRRRGRTWTTLPRRDQQLPPPARHGPNGPGSRHGPAPPRAGPTRPGPRGPAPTGPGPGRDGPTDGPDPRSDDLPF